MNPDEVVQLALAGISALIQLVAKVQAAHSMSDAQLDAYIATTDDKTRAMVGAFLAKMRAAAPVVKVPIPAGDSGQVLQTEFDKARANEAATLAASAPDASTGGE